MKEVWRFSSLVACARSLTPFVAAAFFAASASAQLVINEILFNPPGTDEPNEYIELRGIPNQVLPAGTYLLGVEGDAGGNPGTLQNLFDLSGRRIGGNGFLVLGQKDSPYTPNPGAAWLVNTNSGPGWGDGSTSSVGHEGKNGLTDLKHPSVSFLLIQTTNAPKVGDDLDGNNNGRIDSSILAGWTVLDSVGVLDADGAGDIAYGAVNFRLSSLPGQGAQASGVIIPVDFTPKYIGRSGNSTNATAVDWVAADALTGSPPAWAFDGPTNTFPASLGGAALNHLGAPNFGAADLAGVLLGYAAGGLFLHEGGPSNSFTLSLNTQPAGSITIRVSCGPQLELSADSGGSFFPECLITLSNTAVHSLVVRATADDVIDTSPHWSFVTNVVQSSTDPGQYPVSTLVPTLPVGILEQGSLLLSEVKMNPPGEDSPNEFIEIEGAPGARLTNVCLLAIEGNAGNDPGTVLWKHDLTGVVLGTRGLGIVLATNHPYLISGSECAIVPDFQMSQPGGALGNGTCSLLLVSTATPIAVGQDLDKGDNGVLEGLPPDATILDAIGWTDGDRNDLVYGGVVLGLPNATPDAATRWPGNTEPNSASAWFWGDLAGTNGAALFYNELAASTNFPAGSALTPGQENQVAPVLGPIEPISGVIGDPWNPEIQFTPTDLAVPPGELMVWATSSAGAVVPDTNLVISAHPDGSYSLAINPIGVGYATLTLWASDGVLTGRVSVAYAASAPGRPGGAWHQGASDGSTAIAIDADYMLVGDDENQTLRLYQRNESGLPLGRFDLSAFLDLPDTSAGIPREVDVEASTRVDNRLFWMGSHGHGADGEIRTNRTRVFATNISGAGSGTQVNYAGRYDFLKLDLINWDKQNMHGKGTNYYGLETSDADGVPPKAPDGSGFAIEGLSMMPNNTNGAYLGFRAPIVPATNRTFALVVPVLNFASVAASTGPPGSCVFGPPIELELYGRGIRSLEGNTNGFIIIGGPAGTSVGPYPQDFRLYTWTGQPADQPDQRTADLTGLNPEGIVEVPPLPWSVSQPVQLLTDNGATVFYDDGIQAKHLSVPNFKKCRSDLVPMGAVTKPVPIITSTSLSLGELTIWWRSLKGETYLLKGTTDLAHGAWENVLPPIVAIGPYTSAKVATNDKSRLFRIATVP